MTKPYLSVVVPAFNEEERIASTIDSLVGYLSKCSCRWELLVVNDGSTDSTAQIVSEISSSDGRVRLIDAPHGGKGTAVRNGMMQAVGEWRFLCDADLSMPVDNLGRFFGCSDRIPCIGDENSGPQHDVEVGSREAPGARRFNEPRARHVKGRLFNWVVKILALRGIEDTQCGFKLFSDESAMRLFPNQTLDGWAFDVELLVMAREAGFSVGEIAIDWHYGEGSKMTLGKGALAVMDVVKVGLNSVLGKYKTVSKKNNS